MDSTGMEHLVQSEKGNHDKPQNCSSFVRKASYNHRLFENLALPVRKSHPGLLDYMYGTNSSRSLDKSPGTVGLTTIFLPVKS